MGSTYEDDGGSETLILLLRVTDEALESLPPEARASLRRMTTRPLDLSEDSSLAVLALSLEALACGQQEDPAGFRLARAHCPKAAV